MDVNLISAFIFYLIIFILILVYRKKFVIQSKIIALYKTKFGLKFIERVATSFPRLIKYIFFVGVAVGYIGMVFIFYTMLKGAYILLTVPDSPSMIAPVIPGIKIPGSPLFVPFWYGIIAIFIVVLVHEGAHGVAARVHNLKIKSSGFGMFAIFPIAFVEPDENQLKKSKKKHQLSIFSAGPFSNIILAALVLIVSIYLLIPFALSITDNSGVEINQVKEGYPAEQSGLKSGDIIYSVSNVQTLSVENFTNALKNISINQTIKVQTKNQTYTLTTKSNPDNLSQSYIGVYISQHLELKKQITERYGNVLPWSIFYVIQLFQWIFILSLGIGLANLLPLGPVDGGRILLTTLYNFFEKEKAERIWKNISFLTLLLLIFNFVYPYIRNIF